VRHNVVRRLVRRYLIFRIVEVFVHIESSVIQSMILASTLYLVIFEFSDFFISSKLKSKYISLKKIKIHFLRSKIKIIIIY